MIKLNNGAKMPQVGLGLWKVDKNTCAHVVYNAIKEGYRLFDGACGTYLSRSSFQSVSSLARQPHFAQDPRFSPSLFSRLLWFFIVFGKSVSQQSSLFALMAALNIHQS
jgi:hypothetical protein